MLSNIVSLIFSAVVAAATVAYVILTYKLVQETRRLRIQQFRPQIGVRVEPGQAALGFIDLVVENIGSGPAYGITLKYDSNLELEANPKRSLSDIGFMRNGIRYLGPRHELRTYLMTLFGRTDAVLEGKDRPRFRLEVGYKDGFSNHYSEQFEIDFAHLAGLVRVGSPPLPEIAKHLGRIEDAISHLASGFNKLKVVQYTPEDIEREQANFRMAQISGHLIADATKDLEPPQSPDDAA